MHRKNPTKHYYEYNAIKQVIIIMLTVKEGYGKI
jgi:hypothetical protein